jgi:hypothetical protein
MVVSEIPIAQEFTKNDLINLKSFDFIKYVYVRNDQGGTRQRILVVGKSLEEINRNIQELKKQFVIETRTLSELNSFCTDYNIKTYF